jgi:hypothetical protein
MSTEIATQSQLQEVIVNGSEVLQKSELRVSKALSVGEKLVMEIDATGMNPELDERANKFLVNCRNAKSEIEAQRKPITAFFDTIRKQFTEIEGNLDPKKAGTFPAKLQAHRDAYVKKLRDEEAEKQRIAQAKIDKENEVIEIKSSLQTQFSYYMQDYVLDQKNKLQSSFNKITLENIDEKTKSLKKLLVHYGINHIDAFSPNWNRKLVTQEETSVLLDEFLATKRNDSNLLKEAVESDIRSFVNELIEKLPSLKTSLEEMAAAGAEEQKRLADEKAKREADAQAKMEADAQAEKDKLAKEAEVAKIAEQTNAMMDNMVLAESVAPETRDGFKINVLNKTAIAEIFTFWFQREGMTLTIPEIEKRSITQMKAYCEKVAHKSGDMIQSVNLNYEPVYKAVNRK